MLLPRSYYAIHPDDFKTYDTDRLRKNFLIDELFLDNQVVNHYTHYDRLIIGGVKPVRDKIRYEVRSTRSQKPGARSKKSDPQLVAQSSQPHIRRKNTFIKNTVN